MICQRSPSSVPYEILLGHFAGSIYIGTMPKALKCEIRRLKSIFIGLRPLERTTLRIISLHCLLISGWHSRSEPRVTSNS